MSFIRFLEGKKQKYLLMKEVFPRSSITMIVNGILTTVYVPWNTCVVCTVLRPDMMDLGSTAKSLSSREYVHNVGTVFLKR